MKRSSAWLLAATVTGALAAGATSLNVKTGVWDVSYTEDLQGMTIPASVLAKLTPEQRAKAEASIKARAAKGPQTHKIKSCMTAEDLRKGAFQADPSGTCKNTVVKQTATHQEVTFACTEDGETRSGRMVVDASSPESMKGTVEIITGNGKVNVQLSGKWMSTDCKGADD